MGIKLKESPDTVTIIKAGETYLVPPGHLPVMTEEAVMVEFTQDTTYTNDTTMKKFTEESKYAHRARAPKEDPRALRGACLTHAPRRRTPARGL